MADAPKLPVPAEPAEPKPARKTRRSLLGRTVRGTLTILGGVVTLIIIALVGLQTAPAKRWLASEIEKAASQSGLTLKIGSLEGFVPFSPILRDTTVADAKGVWLQIAEARASVAPAALIAGESVIATLEVDGARLGRLPELPPSPEAKDETITLPALPLSVRLAAISLKAITIDKPVVGRAVTLNLEGNAAMSAKGGTATAQLAIDWDAKKGRARIEAAFRPAGQTLVLRAMATEAPGGLAAALAGLPPEIAYRLTANGNGPLDRWRGRLAGWVTGYKTGEPGLDALLGPRATVSAAVERRPNDDLRVSDLSVVSGGASVGGAVAITDGLAKLDGKFQYRLRDLAPLSPTIGATVKGGLTGTIAVAGAIEGPNIVLAANSPSLVINGETLTALKVDATARGLPDRPRGSTNVSATVRGKATRVSADYALADDRLSLSKLAGESGGSTVTGALTLSLKSNLVQGTVRADVRDVAPWAKFAGVDASGRLDATVTLTPQNGLQSASLSAKGSSLRVGAGADAITVGTMTATARLSDVAKPQQATASISVSAATVGTLRIAKLTVRGNGGAKGLAFSLDGAGAAGHPFTLATKGSVALESNRQTLRLDTLQASFAKQPIALLAPATVAIAPGSTTLDGARLRVATGTVTAKAAIRPNRASIALTSQALPLALLKIAQPSLDLDGTADIAVQLDGPPKSPSGTLRVTVRDFGPAETTATKLPKLQIAATGKLGGGSLALDGTVRGIGKEAFQIAGRVPLVVSLQPFAVSVPPARPLAARLNGGIDLAYLATIVPVGESRVSGRATVALAVAGTPSAPVIKGSVTVDKARYESITTGAVLQDIALAATGDGRSVRITRLRATDGAGGRVSGEGTVALNGGAVGQLDVKVRLAGFRAVRLDEAQIRLSGDLAVNGTALNPRLTGKLTVDRAEIAVPEKLPANIETIDVVMSDGKEIGPRRRNAGPAAPPKRKGAEVALDLDVEVPGRAFLRGQGLVSEWRGALKVTGTTSDPRMTGALNVVRGQFTLLSKRFTFSKGTVSFDGVLDDPSLDMLATAKAPQMTAQLAVTGRAQKPTFTLSSDPVLPRDEVLARLLFGRESGKLTALQAVQLAQAAAALSGGGNVLSITDKVRTALGVDTLDVEGGEDGKTAPGVKVGKYVTDKVYLSVKQGAKPEDSKVTVEVEITPNISVESSTGQTGESDIGVIYRYDY